MSWIGNVIAAVGTIAIAKSNKKVFDAQAKIEENNKRINKEVFEKEHNPLKLFPFELYGHYNIDGYKKVAETIYKFTN